MKYTLNTCELSGSINILAMMHVQMFNPRLNYFFAMIDELWFW